MSACHAVTIVGMCCQSRRATERAKPPSLQQKLCRCPLNGTWSLLAPINRYGIHQRYSDMVPYEAQVYTMVLRAVAGIHQFTYL
jgi:hypothetical protein